MIYASRPDFPPSAGSWAYIIRKIAMSASYRWVPDDRSYFVQAEAEKAAGA